MAFFLDWEPVGEEEVWWRLKTTGGFLVFWKLPVKELKPYGNIGYRTAALAKPKGKH